MGVDGLLQSEIFGLSSVLPPSVVERLTERYKLLGIRNKTGKIAKDLERLTSELDELGVAHSFPHPYFNQFSQALARHPIMKKRQYSNEDIDDLVESLPRGMHEVYPVKREGKRKLGNLVPARARPSRM